MKKFRFCAAALFAFFLFSGCTSLENKVFMDARTILAYPGDAVITSSSEVAILAVPLAYGLEIDDVRIIDQDGSVNPALRVSKFKKSDQIKYMYAIEMLPGSHNLAVTVKSSDSGAFDSITPLETTYDFKAGEVYYLELYSTAQEKRIMITILRGDYRNIVLESRKKAEF